LHQLIKETHGIGVILEHRYYGESMPKEDLSVDSLRFLDTQQALADYAYFAKHIQFPGLEWELLNSDWTSWIVYGGSYAGSFAAFLRTQYPSQFWGAVSSSGVPAAIIDYWQYWEAVRLYGPAECVRTTQDFMQLVDGILLGKKNKLKKKLKKAWGLSHVTDDTDFAAALSMAGVGSWQGKVWDSDVGDPTFSYFCGNITSDKLLQPKNRVLEAKVRKLIKKEGSLSVTDSLVTRMVNWIGFIQNEIVQPCHHGKKSQDACVGPHNESFWKQDSVAQSEWRSWTWQYCTQWGYFQTGSGIPSTIKPIVSRLLTMEYLSAPCRLAFNVTTPPDIESINKYGAFNISYPRLAFVDGQADPWRWAGVHSPEAEKRRDWILEPFVQIKGAVHHWDEYGLFANETRKGSIPAQVAKAQEYERMFVKSWVDGKFLIYFMSIALTRLQNIAGDVDGKGSVMAQRDIALDLWSFNLDNLSCKSRTVSICSYQCTLIMCENQNYMSYDISVHSAKVAYGLINNSTTLSAFKILRSL
jgi:hypothetical protein